MTSLYHLTHVHVSFKNLFRQVLSPNISNCNSHEVQNILYNHHATVCHFWTHMTLEYHIFFKYLASSYRSWSQNYMESLLGRPSQRQAENMKY